MATPAVKMKKLSLKRVTKKKDLNVSRANLKSVSTPKNFSFLNASVQKQTLRANNRALAQDLARARQNLRQANKENQEQSSQIQELSLELTRLRRVAGLRDEEINEEVNKRMQGYVLEMRALLEELTQNMLQSSGCVTKLHDKCLVFCRRSSAGSRTASMDNWSAGGPETQRQQVFPRSSNALLSTFLSSADEVAIGTDVVGESGFGPADMTVIAEQSMVMETVQDTEDGSEKPFTATSLYAVSEKGETNVRGTTKSSGFQLPQRVLVPDCSMSKQPETEQKDQAAINPFKPTRVLLRSPNHDQQDQARLSAERDRTVVSSETDRTVDKENGAVDQQTFLAKFRESLEAPVPFVTKRKNSKNSASAEKDVAKKNANAEKQQEEANAESEDPGNIHVRNLKPGVFTFNVSRKEMDGSRKPVPEKVSMARSKKKKKKAVSPDKQEPKVGEDRDLFNFGDRTPTVPLDKLTKVGAVFDLSLNETVVEPRLGFNKFHQAVATEVDSAAQKEFKGVTKDAPKTTAKSDGGEMIYHLPLNGSPDEKKSAKTKSRKSSRSRTREKPAEEKEAACIESEKASSNSNTMEPETIAIDSIDVSKTTAKNQCNDGEIIYRLPLKGSPDEKKSLATKSRRSSRSRSRTREKPTEEKESSAQLESEIASRKSNTREPETIAIDGIEDVPKTTAKNQCNGGEIICHLPLNGSPDEKKSAKIKSRKSSRSRTREKPAEKKEAACIESEKASSNSNTREPETVAIDSIEDVPKTTAKNQCNGGEIIYRLPLKGSPDEKKSLATKSRRSSRSRTREKPAEEKEAACIESEKASSNSNTMEPETIAIDSIDVSKTTAKNQCNGGEIIYQMPLKGSPDEKKSLATKSHMSSRSRSRTRVKPIEEKESSAQLESNKTLSTSCNLNVMESETVAIDAREDVGTVMCGSAKKIYQLPLKGSPDEKKSTKTKSRRSSRSRTREAPTEASDSSTDIESTRSKRRSSDTIEPEAGTSVKKSKGKETLKSDLKTPAISSVRGGSHTSKKSTARKLASESSTDVESTRPKRRSSDTIEPEAGTSVKKSKGKETLKSDLKTPAISSVRGGSHTSKKSTARKLASESSTDVESTRPKRRSSDTIEPEAGTSVKKSKGKETLKSDLKTPAISSVRGGSHTSKKSTARKLTKKKTKVEIDSQTPRYTEDKVSNKENKSTLEMLKRKLTLMPSSQKGEETNKIVSDREEPSSKKGEVTNKVLSDREKSLGEKGEGTNKNMKILSDKDEANTQQQDSKRCRRNVGTVSYKEMSVHTKMRREDVQGTSPMSKVKAEKARLLIAGKMSKF